MPAKSQRTRREDSIRAEVRTERLRLNPVCEAPARGLPGECRWVTTERPPLEVHEVVARDLAPGSHLVLGLTASLCQWHHDWLDRPGPLGFELTGPYLGGLVLPSHAVNYERDQRVGRRLPVLRPEWEWARP